MNLSKNNLSSITMHSLFWLGYVAFITVITFSFIDLKGALLRSCLNALLLGSLFYLNYLWLAPKYFEQKKYFQYALWIILLTAFFGIIRFYAEREIFNLSSQLPVFRKKKGIIVLILFTQSQILIISLLLRLSYSRIKTEVALREAEINLLKAQLNPHFLFNTLNNIYSLALEKSDKTPDTILKLSEMLRYLLYETGTDTVELKKEVNFIENIIRLFGLKFEQLPNVTFTVDGNIEGVMVEPNLFTPLIENAFKHSNISTAENSYINAALSITNTELSFIVTNSVGNDLADTKSAGIGLQNLRKRLKFHYGENASFNTSNQDGVFTASIKIPKIS